MNIQEAVYREETGLWYKIGEEFKTPGVAALNYREAFELLYGFPIPMPSPVRAARREPTLA